MKIFSKIKNMPVGAKASVAYTFASFFTQGLGIITAPIFTRLLSTTDYGIITTYNSWSSIIGVIAMLALTSGAFSIGMMDYKNDRSGFICSLLVLSNIATLFVTGVYFLFRNYFDSLLELSAPLLILMFLSFMLNPAKNFWMARHRYEYKYKAPIILTIATSIVAPVVSIIAVLKAKNNLAEVKLWSAGIVTLSTSLFFYFYIFTQGKWKVNTKYWKYALIINTPLIIHTLAKVVLDGSDRIMISKMVGMDAAGKYGVIYIVSMVATIVWTSINGSLVPYSFEKFKNREFKAVDNIAKPMLVLYGFACILISFAAPEIVKILAPPAYYDAVYIVPPVAAGIFFTSLYNLFGNIELFYKKTVFIMIATIITAVINLALNFIFIPRFGYIAAAYTTLISLILLSVIHYFFVKKIQEEKIHDIRFTCILSSIIVAICLLCNLLYSYVLLRYAIIFIFSVLIFMYKSKLIAAYKTMKK